MSYNTKVSTVGVEWGMWIILHISCKVCITIPSSLKSIIVHTGGYHPDFSTRTVVNIMTISLDITMYAISTHIACAGIIQGLMKTFLAALKSCMT